MRASQLLFVCLFKVFCIFILKYYVHMVLDFRNYNSFLLSSKLFISKISHANIRGSDMLPIYQMNNVVNVSNYL